jgi:hypothetical protein
MAHRDDTGSTKIDYALTNVPPDSAPAREAQPGVDDLGSEAKLKIGHYLVETFRENAARPGPVEYFPENLSQLTPTAANNFSRPGEESFEDSLPADVKTKLGLQGRGVIFPWEVKQQSDPTVRELLARESEVLHRSATALLEELLSDPEAFGRETSRFLSEQNQFSCENQFISEDSLPTEEEAGTGVRVLQTELGKHNSATAIELRLQDLKNLGCRILLKSSGEVYVPDNPQKIGEATKARVTATGVPGISRLGLRQPVSRFSATEVLSSVEPEVGSRGGDSHGDVERRPWLSYGSHNNPFVPFSSVTGDATSAVVGSLLALAVGLMLEGLAHSLDAVMPDSGPVSLPGTSEGLVERRRARLGSYLPRPPASGIGKRLLEVVGQKTTGQLLVPTTNDYSAAVSQGVQVFFGSRRGEFMIRILEQPGFYNGILRMLVRATLDPFIAVANSVAALAHKRIGGRTPAFERQAGDVNPVHVGVDPTNLLNLLSLVKQSKLLKFMNVIATIGDIDINTRGAGGTREHYPTGDLVLDTMERSDGRVAINPASLVRKQRLSEIAPPGFVGVSTIGTSTIRSLYLIDDSMALAERRLQGSSTNAWAWEADPNFVAVDQTGRVPPEEVELIENELEATYMPFYFHDLRTNEIISFHAFLDELDDSFDVEYASSEGMGRIGKVHSYKNTTRSISVAWTVVATNERDFDQMWFKLNKLMMLVHPQYTEGREIEHEGQTFIQPFSQLVGASPLIRLRLGDVLTSNFNKFDLARLHGLGSRNFAVGESVTEPLRDARTNFERTYRQLKEAQENYEFQVGDRFTLGESAQISDTPPVGETPGGIVLVRTDRPPVETVTRRGPRKNRPQVPPPPVINGLFMIVTERSPESKTYVVKFERPPADVPATATYRVSFQGLQHGLIGVDEPGLRTKAEVQSGVREARPDATAQSTEDVRRFFSAQQEQGNPIVKAFESTAGRGLPGFIKSIRVGGWKTAQWATQRVGGRAPMMLQLELTFLPVNEINPGIDSYGNMIAPIYSVGKHNQRWTHQEADYDLRAHGVAHLRGQATPNGSSDEGNFEEVTSGAPRTLTRG